MKIAQQPLHKNQQGQSTTPRLSRLDIVDIDLIVPFTNESRQAVNKPSYLAIIRIAQGENSRIVEIIGDISPLKNTLLFKDIYQVFHSCKETGVIVIVLISSRPHLVRPFITPFHLHNFKRSFNVGPILSFSVARHKQLSIHFKFQSLAILQRNGATIYEFACCYKLFGTCQIIGCSPEVGSLHVASVKPKSVPPTHAVTSIGPQ